MKNSILDDYTPTEWLVMELLQARIMRMGENIWPFPTELRPTLQKLEKRGLIAFKGGIVAGTLNAWLTDVHSDWSDGPKSYGKL